MNNTQARAAPEIEVGDLHPVALTALLYLQEALRRERYEECAGHITVAQEFGATAVDVHGVLAEPRRSVKAQRAAHALGFH